MTIVFRCAIIAMVSLIFVAWQQKSSLPAGAAMVIVVAKNEATEYRSTGDQGGFDGESVGSPVAYRLTVSLGDGSVEIEVDGGFYRAVAVGDELVGLGAAGGYVVGLERR